MDIGQEIAEEISAGVLLIQVEARVNIYFRNVAFQIFGDNSNKTKLKRILVMSYEHDAVLSSEMWQFRYLVTTVTKQS
jgi:hypothetical protein